MEVSISLLKFITVSSYIATSFLPHSVLSATTSLKQTKVKLSKHPVLLVVSYDGFRYDYMSKTEMPHMESIKAEGASVPFMRAQFPTKTFPNHHSIATGLYPDVHGVTDNVVYDPAYGQTLSGFADAVGFWNFSAAEVQPIWLRNEQAGDDRFSGCYMWAGSSQGYGINSDLFPKYYIPKYDTNVPWEERVDTVISWITNDTQPANLVFLYYNEPDSKGHSFGTDDEETIAEIRKTDNRTGLLIQKLKDAQIYDEINLIILSDHGMHTVHKDNVINITSFLPDNSTYDRYGGTPVFHIQPKVKDDLEGIYATLKAESASKNFSVYKKEEMIDFHFVSNRRISDLIVLADPGFGFEDIATYFNEKGNYGVHGYDQRSPNMSAFFVARGPLFKKGYVSPNFIENVDLFPLFAQIMGFQEAPNNGTLSRVSNLLQASDLETTTPTGTASVSNGVSFKILISVIFLVQRSSYYCIY